MSPFPKHAFYVKLIVSILDILEIDYEYLEIKKVIFGLKKSDEESAKLAASICKAWNYLFLSRKNIEIDDLIFILKILDKNIVLTSNICLCIKEVIDFINNQTFTELEKIFNLFSLVLSEKNANVKVLYLI
ncbi:MAG: hypothetical protein K2N40_01325, partial [Ureaplasma sp.]|nr:hypothetical protein [Ureaplasma sp.]